MRPKDSPYGSRNNLRLVREILNHIVTSEEAVRDTIEMRPNMRKTASFMMTIILAACGGSDSDSREPVDYSGVWDVRYNFVEDGCALTAMDVPGFVDQHIIQQDGAAATVDAVSGLISADDASVGEDGSLRAERSVNQDIFGDGSDCHLASRLSYENLQDDTAESLFEFSISCGGDYSCVSRGIGEAKRQPGGSVPAVVRDERQES